MDFRPLTLDDKPLLDAALAAHPPEISELTFTNLWVWQRKRAVAVSRGADGGIALLCEERGARFFLPPIGATDPAATAARLAGHAGAAGFVFVMRRVPAAMAQPLAAAGFGGLEYAQTLTRHPKFSNDVVERPVEGFDRGDYVAIRATKR